MKLREYHEKLRPFVFHGVDLDNDDKEAQGTCPFCLKESHLGIETLTGKWRCVRCDKSGNIYAFLRLLYEQALATCNADLLAPLSKDRGIKISSLRRFGVTACPNGEYIVPAYNVKGVMANLYKIVNNGSGGWIVMSTPGCNQWPFGRISNPPNDGPLWLMEGLWDAAKHDEILSSVCLREGKYVLSPPNRSLRRQCDILGIPGCKTFHPRFLELIKDRDCIMVFDSDHPDQKRNGVVDGHEGMQKALEIMHEAGVYPSSLKCVQWGKDGYDPDLDDGYDVRDLYRDKGPIRGLAYLDSILQTRDLNPPSESYNADGNAASANVEIVPCNNFESLVDAYKAQKLRVTTAFKDTLAIMCAANLSVTTPGDQLWFRVIGPPGCGKSTMAMAFCGSETCIELSKFTGFHSGYVGTTGERKKGDSSLIPQLHNHMVWNKDADTILTSPQRDSILGESRELYDGESTAHYRNRKRSSYADHRMVFVWCGTDALRGLNRTSLGERFLDCDIFNDKNQEPYLIAAHERTSNIVGGYLSGSQSPPQTVSTALKGVTAGFLKYLWDRIGSYPEPKFTTEAQDSIRAMGELLSYIRATIDRHGHDMAYRPRRELGTRLVSQFTKLATCLACVLGHDTINGEIIRIVRKVMKDTAKGFRMEIIQQLYANKNGLTAEMLHTNLHLPLTTVRHHLRDMLELGIVCRVNESNRSGVRGRKLHYLKLKDEIRNYYKVALRD
jgi:DNA-binding transcriptional ArsR family regulator